MKFFLAKNEKGSTAILALLVMMLLLVIGSAMLAISSVEIRTAASYRDGIEAQYLAEAGAKRALVELNKNGGARVNLKNEVLGHGKYTVTIEQQGMNRILASTGTVNHATRQVVLNIVPESVYDYVAFSGQDMILGVNNINGSIGSNQDIIFSVLTNINGDVIAHDNVYERTHINRINGRVVTGAPVMPLPNIDRATYQKTGKIPDTYKDLLGTHWDGPTVLNNGVYYCDSDLHFALVNIQGPGIIYATGNIDIDLASLSNNIVIISEENISLSDLADVKNIALLAKGDITILLSSFQGTAVAGGNVKIPINLLSYPAVGSGWNVTKNPYMPQPPSWVPDRIRVEYWNNQKIRN